MSAGGNPLARKESSGNTLGSYRRPLPAGRTFRLFPSRVHRGFDESYRQLELGRVSQGRRSVGELPGRRIPTSPALHEISLGGMFTPNPALCDAIFLDEIPNMGVRAVESVRVCGCLFGGVGDNHLRGKCTELWVAAG